MERRHIRKIVILGNRGLRMKEIKSKLQEYYGVNIPRDDIYYILRRCGLSQKGYTPLVRNTALRIYRDFYDTDKGIQYINRRFSVKMTKSSLYCLAHHYGVSKKTMNMYAQSFVTRADEAEIARLYLEGVSTKELTDKYGYKTPQSIAQKLKKQGICMKSPQQIAKDKRAYSDFNLRNIDSKEKAYFLGLLLSDGYINLDRNIIQLQLTDLDAIQFLANYVNVSYLKLNKGESHHKTAYRITLCGSDLTEGIERLSLIENKSKVLTKPNLTESEKQYIPYIIRGIIDGDGWVRKDGGEFYLCSASESFVIWCMEELTNLGFVSLKCTNRNICGCDMSFVRTGIQANMALLKQKIYDHPFGMSRKYNRVHQT